MAGKVSDGLLNLRREPDVGDGSVAADLLFRRLELCQISVFTCVVELVLDVLSLVHFGVALDLLAELKVELQTAVGLVVH